MIDGPVRLVIASLARVSVLTGVLEFRRMRATTWRGSSGTRFSSVIEPTAMPLYCTGLPTDRPVTLRGTPRGTPCQVRSEEYLAAHRPKQQGQAGDQGERADQHVVGFGFHGSGTLDLPRAARAGPWKYSWIHG